MATCPLFRAGRASAKEGPREPRFVLECLLNLRRPHQPSEATQLLGRASWVSTRFLFATAINRSLEKAFSGGQRPSNGHTQISKQRPRPFEV